MLWSQLWDGQARHCVGAVNAACSREISTFPLTYNDFTDVQMLASARKMFRRIHKKLLTVVIS